MRKTTSPQWEKKLLAAYTGADIIKAPFKSRIITELNAISQLSDRTNFKSNTYWRIQNGAGIEWETLSLIKSDWLGMRYIGRTRIFYSCQNNTLSAIDVIYSIGFIVWDTIFISFVLLCFSPSITHTRSANPSRGIKFYGICQLLHHLFIHSIARSLAHSSCAQELHSTFFPILDGMFRHYLGEPQVENFNWWITCCCLQFSFNSKQNHGIKRAQQKQRAQKKQISL